MIGKTQLTGQFVPIGQIPHGALTSATSADAPGAVLMDQTNKRLFIARPDGAGALVFLSNPAAAVNNNADGNYITRVGGVDYAVRVDATHLRIRANVLNPQSGAAYGANAPPMRLVTGLNTANGVTAIAPTAAGGGTILIPPLVGGGEVIDCLLLPDTTTGLLDITVTFGGAGAKPVVLQCGSDFVNTSVTL